MPTGYFTENEVSFKVHGSYLKVFVQQKQAFCCRIDNIDQLVIFNNLKLPKEVLYFIKSKSIPVVYLTPEGEYVGRLENPSQVQAKYVNYQRRQQRNFEFNRATAESIMWAKLDNQHTFLQSWTSHYNNCATKRALNYLTLLMDNLPLAVSVEEVCEFGEEADKVYGYAISSLISFYSPYTRASAKQISNFFNLGYRLLHQYIYLLLKDAGLHPDYSILHGAGNYEIPLAWDFVAEFRAPVVDDLVLSFTRHLGNLNGNGNGNGHKSRSLLQSFLQHWEAKLRTFILHPSAGEVSYRQCMQLQVREYIAALLGDVEYYRPLALKLHPRSTSIADSKKPALTLVK